MSRKHPTDELAVRRAALARRRRAADPVDELIGRAVAWVQENPRAALAIAGALMIVGVAVHDIAKEPR